MSNLETKDLHAETRRARRAMPSARENTGQSGPRSSDLIQ